MEGLESVLQTFFYQFCGICKWIYAFRMVADILKNSTSNNIEGVLKSVLFGSLSYGTLFSVVKILDSVKASF